MIVVSIFVVLITVRFCFSEKSYSWWFVHVSQQQEDEEMLVPHSDLVDGTAQPMEGRTFLGLIQFDSLMKFLVSFDL